MLNSLHVEGDSWLHRMPVGAKLAILLVFGLGLAFSLSMPLQATAACATGALYFSLGLGVRAALRRIRPMLISIAALGLFNIYALDLITSATLTLRLLAILFLASAITATTSLGAFMETLDRLLAPLDRLGLVRAADISLALGLTLRFVPDIADRYEALKAAHQARGIPVRLHRMLGPLFILALKEADSIAEAIDARGIRRHEKRTD
ncbi:energy-coupling factor transporter transmembrane component T family protein [Agrobacterium vitis]|uniref:energy-coupling factor transporter transmembrane component T family protein n=1 Tax=Agrobacterium vitis TaxID=373 RepID=UPI0012E7D8D1|nr:energy-coupling factor transporter transmembrane protein EcfT [Agrobacterium vitis]MVA61320.1 energy-coupling factor transporter transmembrane protein EcfT [Agrobacterium vitis]